jgi:hypothetical protein
MPIGPCISRAEFNLASLQGINKAFTSMLVAELKILQLRAKTNRLPTMFRFPVTDLGRLTGTTVKMGADKAAMRGSDPSRQANPM